MSTSEKVLGLQVVLFHYKWYSQLLCTVIGLPLLCLLAKFRFV
uniref:Uncharacterized protein n=1 Tax=Anguilla anguilla TaxID=7936 RepID=A0A0E9XBA7_ANGAN